MKSNFTLAFFCNVNRLIDNKEFVLGSPITTHQPSSRFCNKVQISLMLLTALYPFVDYEY